jgi:hypothetical protein
VVVGGRVLALVVVPQQPPFSFLLVRYAPRSASSRSRR